MKIWGLGDWTLEVVEFWAVEFLDVGLFSLGKILADMSRPPPTQELVAKDLHGNEWRFRHIFRGDAFMFLSRGENGELCVGVRRAMRQQGNVPSSVISSHNMHLGVLATAWHAFTTKTIFIVYYKPRFTRIVVEIEDADPKRWQDSKWRCLKVRWDEKSSIPHPERVSPWKIEPASAPSTLNPLPMPRTKRPRSHAVPSAPDSSMLTRGSFHNGLSRVLQGQEFSTLRGNFAKSIESDTAEKSVMWPPSVDDKNNDVVSASRRFASENWMSSRGHERTGTDLLLGFGSNAESLHGYCSSLVYQTLVANTNAKSPLQGSDVPYQMRGNGKCSGFDDYPILQGHEKGKYREGNCKLFGIPLIRNSVALEPTVSHTNDLNKTVAHMPTASHQVLEFESAQNSKKLEVLQLAEVHKQGIALGRSVDLTKFNDYDELIAELDGLFEFKGELMVPKKNWLVVYTDDEGDMMLVGDDPWQ
ncbi:hypothetical protein GOBAR_AA39577 [Gossypium barbadense]|uniref:Auxin-responsive protein n=1 Tax=Gossypium barbadense TaxID=3634 RepID=A0A2P5VQL7_GOSBA|nr:hypothetical protein GOBAR_AA39577 [Gossypium barbadense]